MLSLSIQARMHVMSSRPICINNKLYLITKKKEEKNEMKKKYSWKPDGTTKYISLLRYPDSIAYQSDPSGSTTLSFVQGERYLP